MHILPKNTKFNFVRFSNITSSISFLLIIISIIIFFTIGIKPSIDFTGGTVINLSINNQNTNISLGILREELKYSIDESIVVVQTKTQNNEDNILITMKYLNDEKKLNEILFSLYQDNYQINQIESIGPKIGNELKGNARNAISASIILIGIYITMRFDSFYAMGSLIALIHDIVVTLTILILCQYEISIAIIAAMLTIVGYSLNDTIVIYDRIRENLKIYPDGEKSNIINKSLNITLNRTIITSLTTLMVLLVLFFIGGAVLKPFSFALIIGVIIGTYSSMFIATPIMLFLEKKYGFDKIEEI